MDDMEKIKSRITKTISAKEALKDVEPMQWDKDIIDGKKKVVLTSPNVVEKRGKSKDE